MHGESSEFYNKKHCFSCQCVEDTITLELIIWTSAKKYKANEISTLNGILGSQRSHKLNLNYKKSLVKSF